MEVCINLHHSQACGQLSVQMTSEAVWAELTVHEVYYIVDEESIVYNKLIWTYTWVVCWTELQTAV